MSVPVLGAIALPQLPPERLRGVAWAAEDAGLAELWLWEDCFWGGGIATAATALAATQHLAVGVGILPAPLRAVAATAMEIGALARMFPRRVHMGIGHGVQEWMGQVGVRVASPLTLLTEYADSLRALLRGARLSTDGRYVSLTDVALDHPPATAPPVYVGAVGPKTLRLAAEHADGTILTAGTTPATVHSVASGVGEGHEVVVYLLAATGDGADERVAAELARSAVPAGPVEDLAVAGDAETIAAAVRRWGDAGATRVVLQPCLDEPELEWYVRFVGREVRPLLDRRRQERRRQG